jgi:hypothetical protein
MPNAWGDFACPDMCAAGLLTAYLLALTLVALRDETALYLKLTALSER